MKNSRRPQFGLIAITMAVLVASCSPLMEEPIQALDESSLPSALDSSVDLNARKKVAVERNYSEKFTNHLMQVDENGIPTRIIPAYFPGMGEGNSTHMGKALTFLNQFASIGENGLTTVGAPVTQFYAKELAEIGINDIPNEVSSITTDGKGNSVWFRNIKNTVTPVGEEKSEFVANVEIIGGNGKFENATGYGVVIGFFNPKTGEGMSTISGKIKF